MGNFNIPISIQQEYKKYINQVVSDLGREIDVLSSLTTVVCPNCYWDGVTNKSSGVFDSSFVSPVTVFSSTSAERTITPIPFTRGRCPVCFGEGKLVAHSVTTITANISYYPEELGGKSEEYNVEPFGKDGKSYIILKTHEKNYSLLLNCDAIFINDVRYEKVRPPVYDGVGIHALAVCWFVEISTDARIE